MLMWLSILMVSFKIWKKNIDEIADKIWWVEILKKIVDEIIYTIIRVGRWLIELMNTWAKW